MKISKRTMEQAILICAIAASGGVHLVDGRTRCYGTIRLELPDASSDAMHLACIACGHVMDMLGSVWTCEVDAEAEALLRTGWSP